MNISTVLRKEIRKAKRPVRSIAKASGVNYLTLWRWVKGISLTLDHDLSEQVYTHLTGKSFSGK